MPPPSLHPALPSPPPTRVLLIDGPLLPESAQILETPGSVTGAVPQSFMTTGNVHGLMITAGHSCAMSQAGSGSNDGDSFLKWPGLEA